MAMHSNSPDQPTTPVTEASPGSVKNLPPPTAGSARSRGEPGTGKEGRRRGKDDGGSGDEVKYEGSGVTAGLVLLLVLAFAALMLVAQNTDDVAFDFLWWSVTLPLAVLLLAAALLTLALDQIVGAIWRRRRRKMRELTRR